MEPELVAAPSRRRLHLRFAVFVGIALFLQVGPIARQVLALDVPLRAWQMFHIKAAAICDVDFVVRQPDGGEAALSVAEVVDGGEVARDDGAGSRYRLEGVAQVRRAGRAYCKRHRGRDLRAWARCGDARRGWEPALAGEDDLCQGVQ